ncbi:MAG: hypothetical protein MK312_05390 [Roseibacillus sp.]|nr:hypothetical protein [Roseibacillus sp.]
MNRRQTCSIFLPVVILLLPLHAADEPAPVRTCQGDGIYKTVPGWPSYPEGKGLGNLHGDLASDSKGNVYIATGNTIQIIGPPQVPGMYESVGEYNPTDIDVSSDGRVIIADGYGKSLVHLYDKDRNYLKSFGGKGKGEAQFDVCHNILVDSRGKKSTLLISDRQNNRLQQYDMAGNFIRTIDDQLGRPCAADIHGNLLAVGELDGRVSLYDKDYKLISRLGDERKARRKASNRIAPEHWHEGDLIAVHGCTFDVTGALYAQEWNVHGRVTKYVRVKTP